MRERFGWRTAVLALALLGTLALAGCAAGASAQPQPTLAAGQLMLPTATPIPTPTDSAGQALLRVALAAVGSGARSVGVTYDTRARILTVTVTIDGVIPDTDASVAAAYLRAQTLTLEELSALWASGQPLSQVTVIVMGPAQDEYAEIVPQAYSVAMVDGATARRIAWASATPAAAWKLYDQTFLRPSFTVADDIITAPAPTATPG